MLDTFCVIHLFVAPFCAALGVLPGTLTTPKALMVILVGGVSEPLNLFPDFLRGVQKHPVSCPKALPMEAYSPVEDLDKQVPILMFMNLDFPRVFSEFRLRKRLGGKRLKCLPNWKFIGRGIKAIHLRPPGLDFFLGLFVPKGDFIEN